MPVCIAGMHRSGTSMITRLLNLCGLDLGPGQRMMQAAPENPEGLWECVPFYNLNEALLHQLGGTWHSPPALAPGWERADELAPLRERAAALPVELGMKEPWGWKDPRNSVTLPFWRAVWHDLKVVVCLRHPFEVANSLLERNRMPLARALDFWLQYYDRLLAAAPATGCVVTRYDAYFIDPAGEAKRVLAALEIVASEKAVADACKAVVPALRHGRVAAEEMDALPLPGPVAEMYQRLLALAGPAVPPPAESGKRSMLANVLRWAIELEARTGTDDYAFQREQRLRQLEDELTILREHVRGAQTKTRHVMNLLLIEYARRRHADRAIRGFQERLSARRHRYADRFAELLHKLIGPFRRRPAPAPAPANAPAPPKRSSPECAVS